jgi:hypothetical protein
MSRPVAGFLVITDPVERTYRLEIYDDRSTLEPVTEDGEASDHDFLPPRVRGFVTARAGSARAAYPASHTALWSISPGESSQ